MKPALALKIKSVEQDLGDGFGILLREEPLSELIGDSLIRQQFLQINSNLQPSIRGQAKRSPRNRDRRCIIFRIKFSFRPTQPAGEVEGLGRPPVPELDHFPRGF